ncbi:MULTISPECIES: DUF6059 family protein [unclassified Streptomyces]|uniref:DUF6059 family protein n=1 Tax=unclassified Streptomyces TaxID=2593676 RepID=UPI00225B097A|nr:MULTISPECIES: DUF6059 family protein [unclassified Streptomyces]MCX4993177.1 hypothetical protein [Streptomyces sp. NBC_00568]MCX5009385.1 hypothetical protein [Streptomyces sp. NBC_00638]
MSERRRWPSRLLRRVWPAVAAAGLHHVLGEMHRARTPKVPLARPPQGHPERLRPDVPLTSLELALVRELDIRWRSRAEG